MSKVGSMHTKIILNVEYVRPFRNKEYRHVKQSKSSITNPLKLSKLYIRIIKAQNWDVWGG